MSPVIAGVVAAVGTWLIFRVTAGVAAALHRERLPLGPDRQRLAGLAGARHQRRPEDDGRDHPRPDRRRPLERHRRRPALGQGRLRARDRRSAPTSAAGGSSAPSARAWSRSARRRAWPPRAPRAAVILVSSHLGFALSTTHVATGSILGSGVGRPGAQVRWAVAGRMVAGLAGHPAGRRPGRRADVVASATPSAGTPGRSSSSASWSSSPAACTCGSRLAARSTRATSTTSGPRAARRSRRRPREKVLAVIDNLGFALDGAWQVLRLRPPPGAGHPARLRPRHPRRSPSATAARPPTATAAPHPVGRRWPASASPWSSLAVALGITVIVAAGFGKEVSFEHVYPTLVAKELSPPWP